MEFLKNIQWTPLFILKVAGVFLLAVIVLTLVLRILSPIGEMIGVGTRGYGITHSVAPSISSYDDRYSTDGDYDYEEGGNAGRGAPQLSLENVGIPVSEPSNTIGADAEDFEITEYAATIETRDKTETCRTIAELKTEDHIIFENAHDHDRGCSYAFKVVHDRADEVFGIIESLDPKDLTEQIYTIKRELDDFTSQEEVLTNKLTAIDETLQSAIASYDEITALATATRDAESLARVITSKVNTIERLTTERINIVAQLERLQRNKAEQLDRLTYTYFYVTVYENKYIDTKQLADSWKMALRNVVRDINETAQDLTINLAALVFVLLQYIFYFFMLLVIGKFVWKWAKNIWNA